MTETSNAAKRKYVFFRTGITSPSLIETVFSNRESVIAEDETGVRALLKLKHLSEDDQVTFGGLMELLGDNSFGSDDFVGMSSFDDTYSFQWFTYPQVGLLNNQVVLSVGCSNKEHGAEARYFPIVWVPSKDPDSEKKGVYVLQKPSEEGKKPKTVELGLTYTLKDQSDPSSDKVPFLTLKNQFWFFHLPLKVDEGSSYDLVEAAFENGQLQDVVAPFYKLGANFTKIFSQAFINGSFPAEGCVLLLTKGRISESTFEQKGVKKTIQSVNYSVAAFSENISDIPIVDWYFKDTQVPCLMQDIGTISFSNTTSVFKNFEANKTATVYVFVKEQQKGQPEWSPVHTVLSTPDYLPLKVKSNFSSDLALMAAKQKQLGEGSVTPPAIGAVPKVALSQADSEF